MPTMPAFGASPGVVRRQFQWRSLRRPSAGIQGKSQSHSQKYCRIRTHSKDTPIAFRRARIQTLAHTISVSLSLSLNFHCTLSCPPKSYAKILEFASSSIQSNRPAARCTQHADAALRNRRLLRGEVARQSGARLPGIPVLSLSQTTNSTATPSTKPCPSRIHPLVQHPLILPFQHPTLEHRGLLGQISIILIKFKLL